MPDLRPERARALGALMLKLHGDFRRRHDLPPVPSTWALHDHLRKVSERSSLTDPELLTSPKPIIGGLLRTARKIVATVLNPFFYRQTDVNRDLLLALETLTRDSEARRHVHDALSTRIAELERTVSRLESESE